jgi:hypothetical protein
MLPSPRQIVQRLLEANEPDPEPPEVQQAQQAELGLSGGEDDVDAYLLDPAVATQRYLKAKPDIKGHDNHGLFQEWKRKWFMGGRPRRDGPEQYRKLENNTYVVFYDGGQPFAEDESDHWIAIKLHSTYILKVTPDDTVTANMGGWNSVTTRDRMNRYLPGSWGVYTISGSPYWYNNSIPSITGEQAVFRIPFHSGDKILADGTLEYQSEHEHIRRRKKRRTAQFYVHFAQPVENFNYGAPEGEMITRAGPYPSRIRAERALQWSHGEGYVSQSPEPSEPTAAPAEPPEQ